MGRFKNIRLNRIFSLCLISYLIFNTATIKAYAVSDVTTASESVSVVTNISDLNNADNLGNTYTINAKVICVYDERILVNDDTGELWIALDGITIENINIDDKIFATGTLNEKDDKIVLSVTNADSLGVLKDTANDEVLPDDEPVIPDDDVEIPGDDVEIPGNDIVIPDDDVAIPDDNLTTPGDQPTKPDTDKGPEIPNNNGNLSGSNQNNTNKPNINASKPGSNTNQNGNGNSPSNNAKPSGSESGNSNNKPSSNDNMVDTYTGPIIKANSEIVISYNLSDSQWDEIQAAYEAKAIKIKEIGNNKLRITKVSKEYGDTIWIVNDPRATDEEEEVSIFTVGLSELNSIDYTKYDVSETDWNSIIDSVSNGTAKFKLFNDYIAIIYPSASASDYIRTINKKDL